MEPERKSVFASGSGKFFRKLMAQKMEMVKIQCTWSHVECPILSICSGCATSKKIFLGEMVRLGCRLGIEKTEVSNKAFQLLVLTFLIQHF